MSVYAATPPIEALRLILHIAASNEGYKIVTNDVSRAYFMPQLRMGQFIYVKLPEEDILPGEENMCERLNFSMYGTRRAATNWQAHYTKVFVQSALGEGFASNCRFYKLQCTIDCMAHADDFISLGIAIKLFNFVLRLIQHGIEIEVDFRHPE